MARSSDQKKIATVKWDAICIPIDVGRLGIKNLLWQNQALVAKLVWRILTDLESKWAKILLQKYVCDANPKNIIRSTSLPKGSRICNFISDCT